MSIIYGTKENDVIDATDSQLALIEGYDGDDYIIVGSFSNANGGLGNDTIKGADSATTPGAAYYSSPRGISVDFDKNKVEDGFGTVDTLINIALIKGTDFEDIVKGGVLGQEFWAGLSGDFVDGVIGELTVVYWDINPYELKIEYIESTNEFLIQD